MTLSQGKNIFCIWLQHGIRARLGVIFKFWCYLWLSLVLVQVCRGVQLCASSDFYAAQPFAVGFCAALPTPPDICTTSPCSTRCLCSVALLCPRSAQRRSTLPDVCAASHALSVSHLPALHRSTFTLHHLHLPTSPVPVAPSIFAAGLCIIRLAAAQFWCSICTFVLFSSFLAVSLLVFWRASLHFCLV